MPPADLRVCFLGDSSTAGVGDDDGLGWVGRLAASARRYGTALTGYNLGVLVQARECEPHRAALGR
ncbi:hypothetical protein ABC795_03530 [Blastococcus sp. HT6-30]|uniref:hypothetical protein n=1 Tax=Blastococcus sp. HT6-30 TaxID=3144843 RepID=UPI003219F0FB